LLKISHIHTLFFKSFVRRRNDKVVQAAVRSTAIVTSMFPSNVRDRLYRDIDDNEKKRKQHGNLKKYLHDNDGSNDGHTDTPLADLFTETTVLVGDNVIGNYHCSRDNFEKLTFFLFLAELVSSLTLLDLRRGALFVNPLKSSSC
jgi:hypothetical protein